jgi:hypothetical protein
VSREEQPTSCQSPVAEVDVADQPSLAFPCDDCSVSANWNAEGDATTISDPLNYQHSLVVELIEQRDRLLVSDESLPRLLRFVTLLADGAESRGYSVSVDRDQVALQCEKAGHATTLIMGEEYERREVLPSSVDLDQEKLYGWQRVQSKIEAIPSGRLTLEIPEKFHFRGRRRRWADRKRWRLDDKLPEILDEIDARAELVAEEQAAEKHERIEREQEWERAMDSARSQFIEEQRRRLLSEQVNAWHESQRTLAYCHELDKAAEAEQDEPRAMELRSWSAWARSEGARLDPFTDGPIVPRDPEPSKEDLRPFLGKWSPYGADDHLR